MNKLLNYYYLYYHKIKAFLWRKRASKNNCYGLCLMFHGIYEEEQIDGGKTDLDVSLDFFKRSIMQLLDNGYSIVNIEEGLELLKKKKNGKFAIITFDDAHDSVLHYAYPFLKLHNIPFTLFIACDYMQTKGYIDKDHLNEVSKDQLCTVGSHSMSHTFLRGNKNTDLEIEGSKKLLEANLGKEILYFAYPYGSCFAVDYKSVQKVSKYYRAAFSTIDAPLSSCSLDHLYFLPRVLVTPNSKFNEYL